MILSGPWYLQLIVSILQFAKIANLQTLQIVAKIILESELRNYASDYFGAAHILTLLDSDIKQRFKTLIKENP